MASAQLEDERRVSIRGWLALQSLIPAFGLEAGCLLAFGPDRGPMVYETVLMARRGKLPKREPKKPRRR